ncbi:hypothetical protein EVAR_9762_1 [Eumeta japonica]|uniref:NAD-dependent epimerase/dehydratase domain-containing protein n=1 Tax=Eumeta variegata TaxID=151549 RepID=A0A4C1U632_EUMVA|nr:hypothetical protein EVAR_9762_1 [Eumeta japonica]
MSDTGDFSKPRIIVLGGCGFIGRNLVDHLISSNLVSAVRVVDKTPPQLAWLNSHHTKIFEDPRVEYKSANLINTGKSLILLSSLKSYKSSCDAAFAIDSEPWSLAVNCAAETRLCQPLPVYEEGVATLGKNVAKACADKNIRLVEVSTAFVYSGEKAKLCMSPVTATTSSALLLRGTSSGIADSHIHQGARSVKTTNTTSLSEPLSCNGQRVTKTFLRQPQTTTDRHGPHKEDGHVDPWTVEGQMKLKVEKEILDLAPKLRYTIVRPALVYGIGDRRSLTPRLLLGAIYKYLNETMKLLWTADLKLNTIHVSDLCRAIWLVGTSPNTIGKIYNIADENDSTQGSLAELISDIFNIKHDYYGTAMSTLAKNDLAGVAEDANDKHLSAWAELCRGLASTPLEPTTAPELLAPKHLHVDASAWRSLAGAQCRVPAPTVDNLKESRSTTSEDVIAPPSCLFAAYVLVTPVIGGRFSGLSILYLVYVDMLNERNIVELYGVTRAVPVLSEQRRSAVILQSLQYNKVTKICECFGTCGSARG